MDDTFRDQVVVVTGTSRGIGQAAAIEFARLGAKVVSVARGVPHHLFPGTLDETEQAVRAVGGEITTVNADLMEEHGTRRVFEEAMAAYGRCDVLVNNAAASFLGSFVELSLKRLDILWEINVRAPWQLCQLFLPQMIERRSGRIVNVTSGSGRIDYGGASWDDVVAPARDGGLRWSIGEAGLGLVAYGTSKAALDRMTQGLAAEVAEHGIAVNALGVNARTPPNVYFIPDIDGELPEAPAQVITWLAAQPPELTGRILAQEELLPHLRELGLVRPAAAPGDNPDLPSGSSGVLPRA